MINYKQYNTKKFRQSLKDNPIEAMRAQGIKLDETKQYIVHTNTANVIYVAMPNESITQHDFAQIQAAGRVGTIASVGTVASAGSLGSICSCLGSAGTASTAGTAGSVIGVDIKD